MDLGGQPWGGLAEGVIRRPAQVDAMRFAIAPCELTALRDNIVLADRAGGSPIKDPWCASMLQFFRRHKNGTAVGLGVSDRRHWLDYQPFTPAILVISTGFLSLVWLSILTAASLA